MLILSGLLLFLIIFLFRWNYSKFKGIIGEKEVSFILSTLPNDRYNVFNNIYINQNDYSVQIDHVILSSYGIFVVETKNYSGWIYGSDDAEYWTKNMYGNKYRFRNPIKQNYSHIKALSYLFNLDTMYFIPVIVFIDSATIKNETEANVIYASQLYHFINSYTEPIFNETELNNLSHILLEANIQDKDFRNEHIYKVRNNIQERQSLVEDRICPRCRGHLIERNGKYGPFLGCSNYPKCKYTSNL